MAEEVQLPQLGESVEEGIITQWLVEVGDSVDVDQPLVEISTDKVDTEIPSPVAGTVQELRGEVDDTINVGDVIAVIGEATGGEPQADADGPADTEEGSAADSGADDVPESGTPAQDSSDSADAASAPADKPSGGKLDRGDHEYDVVIVGSGTGGYSTALRAASYDLKVALVEKEDVPGGTCLNWGCIPTKAILQTAEIAEHAQEAGEYGVKVDYEGIEVAALNAHKDDVVGKMVKGLSHTLKAHGVEMIDGFGTFKDANTVVVEAEDGSTREVTGAALVIATGSKVRELPFAPFDGEKIISSDHALYLDELPKSAVILGSGAVGMEFATAWNAFGVDVTIIELEDRLLPLEDKDTSKEMAKQYRRKGINAMTGVKMTEVETTDSGVKCTIEGGKEDSVEAEVLLVAVGRAPRTEGIGLEDIGVDVDRGFVVVDEYCRTSVEGVWAVGDVIPTLGLAHASFAEGFLVSDQLGGATEHALPIDYKGVPRVTYSHPEVGSVGYTEQEAKDAGFDVLVEKYNFQTLARAQMMKASGIVKIIAEKDESAPGGAGRVLGVHIVGPKATDLIAEGELIYNWEALPMDVSRFIHAHPSLSEAIGEAHMALAGRALHG